MPSLHNCGDDCLYFCIFNHKILLWERQYRVDPDSNSLLLFKPRPFYIPDCKTHFSSRRTHPGLRDNHLRCHHSRDQYLSHRRLLKSRERHKKPLFQDAGKPCRYWTSSWNHTGKLSYRTSKGCLQFSRIHSRFGGALCSIHSWHLIIVKSCSEG